MRKGLQPQVLPEQLIEAGGLEKADLGMTTHRFEVVQVRIMEHSMVREAQFLEDVLVAKEAFLGPPRLLQV